MYLPLVVGYIMEVNKVGNYYQTTMEAELVALDATGKEA